MTDTDTDTASRGALVWLDPHVLADHPANLRAGLGELGDLAASIASRRVIEPLVVIADGDRWRILAGHRRNAAAITAGAGRVPCIVRNDLAGADDQIITMLVENTRRRDLTVAEEANGYHQLNLTGLSQAKIAKATGAKTAHIKRSLTVARSDLAAAALNRYHLTLDQALAVAEFDTDANAVKLLVVTATKQPDRFAHVLARLREDRRAETAHAATVDRLAQAGITVIDPDDLPNTARALHQLAGPDGRTLNDATHSACPGHAVTLDPWTHQPRDVYCVHPASHGHHHYHRPGPEAPSPGGTGADSETGREEARAERRRVIDGNRDWRAARHVRRDFLRQLLTRRTPPKSTLRYVVTSIVTDPGRLADGNETVMADLLGPSPTPARWGRAAGPHAALAATDTRLPLVALAQVAAATETAMTDHTWRQDRPVGAARWLSWLASVGYTLSDIETRVVDNGNQPNPHTSTANDDSSDGDGR